MPSAYHQVHLPENVQDRLSFVTPWATFKYLRMVFGLKSAASVFQALMDLIIEECGVEGIYSYQDDVIIASNSFEETCQKLEALLKIFVKYNLTFCASKCSFHQLQVRYLGFEITQNKIFPVTSNIVKITSFPRPHNKRQLKKFIGTCAYYQHLIPQFAKIMAPLIQLTSPKVIFKWEDKHDKAFTQLQDIFFNKPFLIQPNFDEHFYLNTDASHIAISAILLQRKDNNFHPIAYYSKALSKTEKKYPAIKLELMAIVKGILAFKYYLYGRKFTILSDSRPLQYYSKTDSPADLTTRWLLKLEEYNYQFEHIPGSENVLADLFSRTIFNKDNTEDIISNPNLIDSNEVLPVIQNEEVNAIQHVNKQIKSININNIMQEQTIDPPHEISLTTILKEQLKDKKLSKIYNNISNNKTSKYIKSYVICPSSKVLMFIKNTVDNHIPNNRIILPQSLQAKALRISHLPHFGIQKTFESLDKKYYWYGSYADTVNFVRSCEKCNATKHHTILQAPWQNNRIPTYPGEFISMDLVGPFANGLYILTIIDHFSRFLTLTPLRTISSDNIVKALFDYITVHGRPAMILSDLGKQFTSQIFQDFASSFGIRLLYTSSAHPQCNAISERINSSIKNTIATLQKDGYNFYDALKIHQALYNSSVHSSTKFSPNFIHFGRDIGSIYDTFVPMQEHLYLDRNRNFYHIMTDLEEIYRKVHENLILAQQMQNNKQGKSKLRNIKVGDIVYIKNTNKLKNQFLGPFTVLEKCSPVNYKIQRVNKPNSYITTVHSDRIWLAPPRRQHLVEQEKEQQYSSVNDTSYQKKSDMPKSSEINTPTNISSQHVQTPSNVINSAPDSLSSVNNSSTQNSDNFNNVVSPSVNNNNCASMNSDNLQLNVPAINATNSSNNCVNDSSCLSRSTSPSSSIPVHKDSIQIGPFPHDVAGDNQTNLNIKRCPYNLRSRNK